MACRGCSITPSGWPTRWTRAVDGVDGWNQVRAGGFDLLVTDVDMPRMTGLQLVQAVRSDARLRDLPAVIVSYKEREEDRLRHATGRLQLADELNRVGGVFREQPPVHRNHITRGDSFRP